MTQLPHLAQATWTPPDLLQDTCPHRPVSLGQACSSEQLSLLSLMLPQPRRPAGPASNRAVARSRPSWESHDGGVLLQGSTKEGAIKPVSSGAPASGAAPSEKQQSRAGVKDSRDASRAPTERRGLPGRTLHGQVWPGKGEAQASGEWRTRN